jgi:hypothetical protein
MDGLVVAMSRERACSARLANDILVVFPAPPGAALGVGDRLRFMDLRLDASVRVLNLTREQQLVVHIAAHEVHDLRLPADHGGSRTPSHERLHAP